MANGGFVEPGGPQQEACTNRNGNRAAGLDPLNRNFTHGSRLWGFSAPGAAMRKALGRPIQGELRPSILRGPELPCGPRLVWRTTDLEDLSARASPCESMIGGDYYLYPSLPGHDVRENWDSTRCENLGLPRTHEGLSMTARAVLYSQIYAQWGDSPRHSIGLKSRCAVANRDAERASRILFSILFVVSRASRRSSVSCSFPRN